jgi:hypothetical protein
MFPSLPHVSLMHWGHLCCTSIMLLPNLQSLLLRDTGIRVISVLIRSFRECLELGSLIIVDSRETNPNVRDVDAAIEAAFEEALKVPRYNIETLEFYNRTPKAVISRIGSLPRLRRLKITSKRGTQLPIATATNERPTPNEALLPSLRVLIIDGGLMDNLEALTRYLTCPLETMDLTPAQTTSQALYSWIRVLREIHPMTLRHLSISRTDYECHVIHHDFVSSIAGRPLRNLQLNGFRFKDEQSLINLAECLPLLENLEILDANRNNRLIFSTFTMLLRTAPNLVSLSLDFDFSSAAPEHEVILSTISPLKSLHVGQSRIANYRKVVEVFRQILPKLQELRWRSGGIHQTEWWRLVHNDLLF